MASDLLAAYQLLKRLADAQLVALEDEQLETFWQLTEERDAAFDALRALEPQAKGLSPADRQAIATLIPAVLQADERIESHLNRLQGDTQREIAKLHTGMNALNSYTVGRAQEAYFIDRPS